MELIVPVSDAPLGMLILRVSASVIIIGGALLIIYFIYKRIWEGNSDKIKYAKFVLIYIMCFFTILSIGAGLKGMLFYIDRNSNDVIEKAIYVDAMLSNNSGRYIVDSDGTKYKVDIHKLNSKQLRELLEENFVGRTCEIEYYRRSKYLIRIKVIE